RVPGGVVRDAGDVVTGQRRDRDEVRGVEPDLVGQCAHFVLDVLDRRLVVVEQVDLVDGDDDVPDAQAGDDGEVASGLLGRPVAGVDEDDDGIGGRGSGDHVPGVLHMAGAVGEDERAAVGGEVAVGDVDGDALFAFGPQTVGEQREVELPAEESAFGAGDGHGFELVGQDRLRIMEQSAHQGGFAVVDGPGGGEAQQRLRLCR